MKRMTQDDLIYALCLIGDGASITAAAREIGVTREALSKRAHPETLARLRAEAKGERNPLDRSGSHAAARKPGRRRKRRSRYVRWSEEEVAILRRDAGRFTSWQIAQRIATETGRTRTEFAIQLKAKTLGLCLWSEVLSLSDVCRIMGGLAEGGTPRALYRHLILTGLLPVRRNPGPLSHIRIEPKDFESFLRTYPWAYDWRRMPAGRWRTVAELTNRVDPWLTTNEAAAWLGVVPAVVGRYCKQGLLEAHKQHCCGPTYGVTSNGAWRISRASLLRDGAAIRERMEEARRAGRNTGLLAIERKRKEAAA
jgi:hypothetical protein